MASRPAEPPKWNRLLSQALRLIRRARQLRARDVAAAMDLPLRSYEHFESGAARPSLERIHAFASATDSDPHAILAALMIASPPFALRAADNKLMTAFLITLREFDRDLGDQIADLETRTIVAAFSQAFDTLSTEARRRRAWREAWLADAALGGDMMEKTPDDPDANS